MQIYKYNEMTEERIGIMKHRSSKEILNPEIFESIRIIAEDVKKNGDRALIESTAQFDKVNITKDALKVPEAEFSKAKKTLHRDIIDAIHASIKNYIKYNERFRPMEMEIFDIEEGITAGRKASPFNSVALYVPCGKGSYPSSFITISVPAIVAGVKDINVIVPPKPDGSIDPAILFIADILGIKNIYRTNGVAGIFAATFGTETIKKVEKIVGPGGNAIMAAQMYAQLNGVGVGLFFGPSECMIIADISADPVLIAADLINEAEHGSNSSAILITDNYKLAETVKSEIQKQLSDIPEWRRNFAISAMEEYGGIVVVDSINEAVDLANDWANEHIQIVTRNPWEIARKINSASEILIGQNTTFSAISYAIGVPACLPTGQFAKIYSGVTVDTFIKYSAITELNGNGLKKLSKTIIDLSEYEGFPAHTRSIKIRNLNNIYRFS